MYMFPAEFQQGDTLPSCFSPHTVNLCPFCVSAMFFTCFWFLLPILLFKMTPSVVLKWRLVVPSTRRLCCALWRRHVSDKLQPGMSCSVAGCAFNVMNQQHTLNNVSLNRNTYRTCIGVNWLFGENVPRGSQELNLLFSLGVKVQYPIILYSCWVFKTWLLLIIRINYTTKIFQQNIFANSLCPKYDD